MMRAGSSGERVRDSSKENVTLGVVLESEDVSPIEK